MDSAPPQWTDIPSNRYETVSRAFGTFQLAHNKAIATPTPANILARNQAQVKATKELRPFVNQFLRFPPVTDIDRTAMGIPNHDSVRTDHTTVAEKVSFTLTPGSIREVIVHFQILGETHKAKPQGYDGAVIVWDVLDKPPARTEVLTKHTMASRTPHTLRFDETERGKTVYVACAWQNERGILGPWSDIKSTIIP